MKRVLSLLYLAFALCALPASASYGQTVGAVLQGTVSDITGAVLPGATVAIKNSATGGSIEVLTDERGRYLAALLQPGEYEIQVSLTGFQTISRRGVRLAVGQNAVVDIKLDVGQITREIDVVADVNPINLTSAALSGLVNDKEIRDLPLNGRSFQQLALLQPGVTAALAAGNDVVGGRTPKITINGARPEQNNFLLDGTDINNVYNKTPGSVAGVLLGVEGVLEFQVLTNAYSAEFGRSAGGVINAVTRSGQNRFTGSLFEFHRNSAFDAKNFFDPADKEIPAFKRNQFGGAVGGPIRKDKTFFFAAYESLIERLGVTGVSTMPDENARKGLLQAADSLGNPLFNPDGTPKFRQVQVHPAIPAYLNLLFPHVNGRLLKNSKGLLTGVGEYIFSRSQPTNEHFLQGRIDHQLSSRDTLWGRYTFDSGDVDRQPSN